MFRSISTEPGGNSPPHETLNVNWKPVPRLFFDIPILRRSINKRTELVRRYSVVSVSPLENRSMAQFHVTSREPPENYEQLRFNRGHLFIKTEKPTVHIYGPVSIGVQVQRNTDGDTLSMNLYVLSAAKCIKAIFLIIFYNLIQAKAYNI